ncbi:hypothetical protein [Clostridium tarantellae]|uniref:Uncharacterized protein n=1 Tax=Clostridium tarantellae TaxID=39493 RepID=A0A6I1MRF0_9CLOT|nr:hypothetical protein [Clostridium tarantellae]MPQ45290.1 hypothetical protein [Clostridium tarantellae]
MTYKFKLNDSHYDSLAKYNLKTIKLLNLIIEVFFNILIFIMLLFIVFASINLSKSFHNGSVALNYIISIIFIIVILLLQSIPSYKKLMKSSLKELKFLPYLARAKYKDNDECELIVEENSLTLKSYGYSIEIPKSNITSIKEMDNIILVFNKSRTDTLLLPREIIKVEDLK